MDVSPVNSPSFTSVIPTRVFVDGREAISNENVQKGCKKLIEVLAGPTKNNPEAQNIARKFAMIDRDYDYARALNGYVCKVYEFGRAVKKTASHFFRYINSRGTNLLVTGPQAEALSKTGKQLGLAKAAAKSKGVNENVQTFEILETKKAYGNLINKITGNRALRVREGYDKSTKQNLGNETVLHIFLKSNQKYGKKNFKVKVENIEFKPYGK